MGFLRRGKDEKKRKEERDEDFDRNLVLTEEAQPAVMTPEYVASMGQSYFNISDPDVKDSLDEEEKPAYSPVNRLSNIGEREAELLRLQFEELQFLKTLTSKRCDFQAKGMRLEKAKAIFANIIVSDSVHGWKGKMQTEHIKVIRTERITEKKKRFR